MKWNAEDRAIRTCRVPWAKSMDWAEFSHSANTVVCNLRKDNSFAEFLRRQFALVIFDANRMEGTLSPELAQSSTMQLILQYWDSSESAPDQVAWNAEGGREHAQASTNRQLYQFAAATQHLLVEHVKSKLTVKLLQDVHAIMMDGAYEKAHDGVRMPFSAGALRSKPEDNVYAGLYQFVPPRAVAPALDKLVSEFHSPRVAGMHPVNRATWLFYELITIHPFKNGNGRLCRLFLSWSLMQDGLPFPVSFSTGHKKKRDHYLRAIEFARRAMVGHRGELNNIALVSIHRVTSNYCDNQRRMAAVLEES